MATVRPYPGKALVGRLWLIAAMVTRLSRKELQGRNISEDELSILRYCCSYSRTFSELAGRIQVPPYQVTRIAMMLEKKGFARALQSKRDRRVKRLSPTKAGMNLIREVDVSILNTLLEEMPGPYGKSYRVDVAAELLRQVYVELSCPSLFDKDPESDPCDCGERFCAECKGKEYEERFEEADRTV